MESGQNGNVLFLILIAVALFAALSFAVSKSMHSPGGSPNREKNTITISTLYSLFAEMDGAMTRMQTSYGCTSAEIGMDFSVNWVAGSGNFAGSTGFYSDHTDYDSSYEWAYDPRADGDCNLFGMNGGGVKLLINRIADGSGGYNLEMIDPSFIFSNFIVEPRQVQNMTSHYDLIVSISPDYSAQQMNAFRPICDAINTKEGVALTNSGDDGWAGAGSGDFWGKTTYCLNDGTNMGIVHVIAAR